MTDRVPEALDLTDRMPRDAFDPEDGATIRVVRQDEPVDEPVSAPRARGTRPQMARVPAHPSLHPPGLPARAKRWTQLPPPIPPPRVRAPSSSTATPPRVTSTSTAPPIPPPRASLPTMQLASAAPPIPPSLPTIQLASVAPPLPPRVPPLPAASVAAPSHQIAAPGADTSAFAAWLLPEGEVADSTWFDRAESVPIRRQRAKWPYAVGVVLVGAVLGAAIVLFTRRDPTPTAGPPKVAARVTTTAPAPTVTTTAPAPSATAPPPAVATPRASKASRSAKPRKPAIERRTPATGQPHEHAPARSARAAARPTDQAGGHGSLRVVITPPCEIAIDGKSTKLRSPQENLRLPVGTHRVTLTNAGANIRRTIELTIAPGKTTQLVRDFTAQ